MLTKPSGKNEYLTAAQINTFLQTMASDDGIALYPAQLTNDLKKVVLNRGFYSIESLKKEIEKQLQYMLICFYHSNLTMLAIKIIFVKLLLIGHPNIIK